MNPLRDIMLALDAQFPMHHVVVKENGWPYGMRVELVGPRLEHTWGLVDKLEAIFGCSEVQLLSPLYDDVVCSTIEAKS